MFGPIESASVGRDGSCGLGEFASWKVEIQLTCGAIAAAVDPIGLLPIAPALLVADVSLLIDFTRVVHSARQSIFVAGVVDSDDGASSGFDDG